MQKYLSDRQRRGFKRPTKRIVARQKRVISDAVIHRKRKERVEIQKIKKSYSSCIPRSNFGYLVRDITLQYGAEYRFQSMALDVLQNAAEALLTQLFSDCVLLAEHAKRVTIMDRDVVLLLKLQRPRWS